MQARTALKHLPMPQVVVEEVFENERFQPFRGWGHMWPGHFLPSDRVGHWGDRQVGVAGWMREVGEASLEGRRHFLGLVLG